MLLHLVKNVFYNNSTAVQLLFIFGIRRRNCLHWLFSNDISLLIPLNESKETYQKKAMKGEDS